MIKFLLFVIKCFLKCIFRIKINGADNIPTDGGCMICANHISAWDPVVLICCMPRRIAFVSKEEMKSVPFIGWLLTKVDVVFIKRGSGDIGAIRACLKGIEEGKAIGIFPQEPEKKFSLMPNQSQVQLLSPQRQARRLSRWASMLHTSCFQKLP